MNHPHLLTAAQIATLTERRNVHQFNDQAVRHTRSLGDLTGLTSIGIHLVRVELGDETTQHHNHEVSDEFIYILSGKGTLLLGEQAFAISAGDFVGFPKKGPAHSMKNTGTEDLVYLMGGGRPPLDICNYPNIGRRMYLIEGKKEYVDLEHLHRL